MLLESLLCKRGGSSRIVPDTATRESPDYSLLASLDGEPADGDFPVVPARQIKNSDPDELRPERLPCNDSLRLSQVDLQRRVAYMRKWKVENGPLKFLR